MKHQIHDTGEDAARAAAEIIADAARRASGRFSLALSGGSTPRLMLEALAAQELPWNAIHVFQVDERVAPRGHAERNDTMIRAALIDGGPLPAGNYHPMPVEADDLDAATRRYGDTIAEIAGSPPVIDFVHLGLGNDGHTASLFPDDPVLDVTDRSVAMAGEHLGRRRMTLTYPVIDAARTVVFLVTGASKTAVLERVIAGDRGIPAGRVSHANAYAITDKAAAPDKG